MKAIILLSLFLFQISLCSLRDDRMGYHGFIILAHDTKPDHVYLSHIPMYMSPHDYQFLFEAKITSNITLAKNHYYSTIHKDKLSLSGLINGTVRQFKTDLYEANFLDEILIEENATIRVTNRIYNKQLSKDLVTEDKPKYVIFGGGCTCREYTLLHVVGGPDNFDHIVKATLKSIDDLPRNEDFIDGEIVTIDGVINDGVNRIKIGKSYTGNVNIGGIDYAISIDPVFNYACRTGPSFDPECGDNKLAFLH